LCRRRGGLAKVRTGLWRIFCARLSSKKPALGGYALAKRQRMLPFLFVPSPCGRGA
jgi:hypothetical protein